MDKKFNVRIQQLCKTKEEWALLTNKFKPALGELCIYTDFYNNPDDIMFKVGDGDHFINELAFTSARASDVYPWAKTDQLEWENDGVEVPSEGFKDGLIRLFKERADTFDTRYRIVPCIENEKEVPFKWQVEKTNEAGEWELDRESDILNTDALDARLQEVERQYITQDAIATEGETQLLHRTTHVKNTGFGFEAHTVKEEIEGDLGRLRADIDIDAKEGITLFTNRGTDEAFVNIAMLKLVPSEVEGSAGTLYYTKQSTKPVPDDEVATKRDIGSLIGTIHLCGTATTDPTQAKAPDWNLIVINSNGEEEPLYPKDGDLVLFKSKEFICVFDAKDASKNPWHELGGGAEVYVTKEEAEAAHKALEDALEVERQIREAEDNTLQANIDNEAAVREAADNDLQEQLDAEIINRENADKVLQEQIDAEVEARKTADGTLKGLIDAEERRAKKAEHDLSDDINLESARAKEAETTNATAIAGTQKWLADVSDNVKLVSDALSREVDHRVDEDNRILSSSKTFATDIVRAEESERKAADTELANRIAEVDRKVIAVDDKFTTELADVDQRISNERSTREAADKQLSQEIAAEKNRAMEKEEDLEAAVNAEATRAKQVEEVLRTDLTTEVERSQSTERELHTQIDIERDERKAEDQVLSDRIDDEETARTKDVSDLDHKIDTEITRAEQSEESIKRSVESEKTRAESKESELKKTIEEEIFRAKSAEAVTESKLETEISRAKEEEAGLKTEITNERTERIKELGVVNEKIETEKTERIEQTTELATNLTAVTNKVEQIIEGKIQLDIKDLTQQTDQVIVFDCN